MPFRYQSSQIGEIVAAAKYCGVVPVRFDRYGESGSGRKFETFLGMRDGSIIALKLKVSAGVVSDPTTFSAALVLDGERIRGVDYSHIERRRYFRLVIPRGWHQNLIDPGLPTGKAERNRHESIPDCKVTDLQGFLRFIGSLWNIDFGIEETLL